MATTPRVTLILRWIIITVFALFFAYDVWEGIGNFLGIVYQSLSLGFAISAFGWFAIVLGIVAPIFLFFLAVLFTRKRDLLRTSVIFVVALSISAVIGVDLTLGTNAFLIFTVT